MKRKLYIALPLVLTFLLAVFVEVFKPRPINWTPSYMSEDKIPFGAEALFSSMKDIFPPDSVFILEQPIYNELLNGYTDSNNVYLFIDDEFKPDKLDIESLLDFVSTGNTVFIAAGRLGKALSDTLKIQTKFNPIFGDSVYLHSTGLPDSFKIRISSFPTYISKYDTTNSFVLGRDSKNHAVFIKTAYGAGNIFYHSVPSVFTNYNFLKSPNEKYIARVFSHLPYGPLYWDEHYKSLREMFKSPMVVILNNQALRWAYFTLLLGIVFFILIEGKRRQRLIPVIEPLKNESLIFAETVGRLYYQHADHKNLVLKMHNYFFEFIHHTFNLLPLPGDEKFIKKLSGKSSVPQEDLVKLFKYFDKLDKQPRVIEDNLLKLNIMLEKFYSVYRGNRNE